MPLECGDRILVMYDGFALYHERIILGHVKDSSYFVVMPDHDVFVEDFGEDNEDISAVRVLVGDVVPLDLRRAALHCFRAPVAAA